MASGTAAPEQEGPTEPEIPAEPEDDTATPEDSATPEDPAGSQTQSGTATLPAGGSMSQMGGSYSGGTVQEETYELYDLETVSVATVTSQEEMTVQITVDEMDILEVYVGQSADVTLDALTGEHFTATVTQIGSSGENEGGNSKFTVELTLPKSSDMLPGMQASVTITLGSHSGNVCIPVTALTEEGAKTVVYTGYDEENGVLTDPVEVTTGVSDGETVQILEGITEGMTCYYAYYDTVQISNVPETGRMGFFGR